MSYTLRDFICDKSNLHPTEVNSVLLQRGYCKEDHFEVVGGIKVYLPRVPDDKREILNYKKLEEGADPQDFKFEVPSYCRDVSGYSKDIQVRIIEREIRRRVNGVFAYLYNPTSGKVELKFITGHFYYYNCYHRPNAKTPISYREEDRKYFLFQEAAFKDPRCTGIIIAKSRRQGATEKALATMNNMATLSPDENMAIISKTKDDGQKNFERAVNSFHCLPSFFKPLIAGEMRPKKRLEFGLPSTRSSSKERKQYESKGLNTNIEYGATTENSLDGMRLGFLLVDEAAKFKDVNINRFYSIHKECLVLGDKKVGKMIICSTTNEAERGGGAYRQFYYDSDITERNANGGTKTGLYSYFCPADRFLEGFVDPWGYPVIEGASEEQLKSIDKEVNGTEYLQNILAGLTDASLISEQRRKYPLNLRDAFKFNSAECIFNIGKLSDQIEHVEANVVPKKNFLISAKLMWEDPNDWSKGVKFVPSPQGHWQIVWLPKNTNGFSERQGLLVPKNDELIIGVDPYRTDGDSPRGSKGTIAVYHREDGISEWSNHFVAVYKHRPAKIDLFFEEVLKVCMLYGAQVLPESNIPSLIYWLRDKDDGKYEPFLMMNPSKQRQSASNIAYGINTNEATATLAMQHMEKYIEEHCDKIYFLDLLKELVEYEHKDRRKSDLVMATYMCFLGAKVNFFADNGVTIEEAKKSYEDLKSFLRVNVGGDGAIYGNSGEIHL